MVGHDVPARIATSPILSRARAILRVALVAHAACGAPATPAKPVANRTPSDLWTWTFAPEAAGPIRADTAITDEWLRRTFGGVHLERDQEAGQHWDLPVTRGTEGGEHWWFEVRDRDELLLTAVVDAEDDRVTRVSVTSARIGVAGHRWRVGQRLADTDGLECACPDSIDGTAPPFSGVGRAQVPAGEGSAPRCHVSGDYLEIELERIDPDACATRGNAYVGRTIERINWFSLRPVASGRRCSKCTR